MGKIYLLFLAILVVLSFSVNVNSSTLKVIIEGPSQVLINYPNGSILLISNSSNVQFNESIRVTIFSVNPSYYITVNGTNYFSSYSTVINNSEILCIKAIPEYVKITLNLNGTGKLKIMINNGSTFTVNKSTSFLVLNNSIVYITSEKTFEINGITTNFYLLVPTSNVSLDVNFISYTSPYRSPKITSQDFLGIGLGLIGLSLYLFFKRKTS